MTTAVAVPSPGATARALQVARDVIAQKLNPETMAELTDVLVNQGKSGNIKAIEVAFRQVREPARGATVAVQQNNVCFGRSEALARKLAAFFLFVHRSASAVSLANVLELPLDAVPAVLEHEWFRLTADGDYELTPEGRRTVSP